MRRQPVFYLFKWASWRENSALVSSVLYHLPPPPSLPRILPQRRCLRSHSPLYAHDVSLINTPAMNPALSIRPQKTFITIISVWGLKGRGLKCIQLSWAFTHTERLRMAGVALTCAHMLLDVGWLLLTVPNKWLCAALGSHGDLFSVVAEWVGSGGVSPTKASWMWQIQIDLFHAWAGMWRGCVRPD